MEAYPWLSTISLAVFRATLSLSTPIPAHCPPPTYSTDAVKQEILAGTSLVICHKETQFGSKSWCALPT